MTEMRQMTDTDSDCWYARVEKVEKLLGLPRISGLSKTSGKVIKNTLSLKYQNFLMQKINCTKPGTDGTNHNKLRT